jgi:nucleoside-diphosphate-sugar epimerase
MTLSRVLITGGAGYIGTVLAGLLLDAGYHVTILDRLYFPDTLAHLAGRQGLTVVKDDVRTFDPALLEDIHAVCDLAALSNDPAGELDPDKTMQINFRGRARVAALARERGVQRYILASSCSIYGFQDGLLDERSAPNPLTVYAQANLAAERAALPLASDRFAVTVLRQATVYGLSARMRFDLAINGMTLGLWRDGSIPVLRDGTQWRPMVHVRDTGRAFLLALQAGPELINGQLFNVGSAEQNVQIMPLAGRIAEAIARPFRFEWYGLPDHRSYRVSFDKIAATLGYRTEIAPEDAAREVAAALDAGTTIADLRTRTVDWYKHLLAADPHALDAPGTNCAAA